MLDALAARLLDRLDDTSRKFAAALDFGGRGSIAPKLSARGIAVVSADISPQMARLAGGLAVAVDGEALPFGDQKFDLIVAHCSLQWVNDLPGALIQLRRALKPDGLFLASMPVLGTLATLRTALLEAEEALTGRVSTRICGTAPDCCNAPVLWSRSRMSRISICCTPARWRCCMI